MNGNDLLNNLIDELNRAKELIKEIADLDDDDNLELIADIDADLERVYDYKDSLEVILEDLEIK